MNARPHFAAARPVAFDPILADAWRYSAREVEEHIRFIRQHLNTIANRCDRLPTGTLVHSPAYVAQAEKLLAHRLPLYRAALRRVTEAEQRMTAIGMAFAKSSDAA